jgi:MEKHLA domain
MAPWTEDELRVRACVLLRSYRHWAGEELLGVASDDDAVRARALFDAPFAVLAHDTRPDPLCIYANAAALAAFELSPADAPAFATSRTVAPAARDERRAALARANQAGLLRGYSGVRVSTAGRRFEIHDGRIWTLLDDDGRCAGQAAAFRSGPA